MINKKQFTCTKNGRLDEILAEHLQLSRSQAQKYIKQGVEIDGKKISKSGCSIKEGQVVTFYSLEIKEEEKPDLDIVPYKTIYEDNDILVINKPRGLVVHPSAGHKNDTLVNYLVHHYKTLSKQMEDENTDRPGIIHRIDKDTSGLLIVAKNDKAHRILAEELKEKKIKRKYIALVSGVINHDIGEIDAPIGRDPSDRKKMCVTSTNSKDAITHFRVLERYKNASLIECELETGRTHQIRVHMKYINHPVINDPVYGKNNHGKFGQLLHAKEITFTHPTTKEVMTFSCEVPEEFNKILEEYKEE